MQTNAVYLGCIPPHTPCCPYFDMTPTLKWLCGKLSECEAFKCHCFVFITQWVLANFSVLTGTCGRSHWERDLCWMRPSLLNGKTKSMKGLCERVNATQRRRQSLARQVLCETAGSLLSLCACGFHRSFTSLWPHLSQHPSVILSLLLPTPPPLSLSAHLPALRVRVCVCLC